MTAKTIRDILGARRVQHVGPETSVRAVAQLLAREGVGAVAVTAGGALLGIVSERDIVFRAVAAGLPADIATAAEIMTPEPVTVGIDDALSDALAAHLGDTFRHLPVMEEGRLVGLLSFRDIPAEYVMMFERFREMASARADEGL